ncbi:hypothetical protein AEA09_10540 [Lysinibacillus contaminans]|uniref:Uncharacterized protein n=1 Tax=Lysinibacillus contaminans TaxID=1293441 RepID=A0ABR5K2P1_9BACI|nr:hypothetical protein [Lysinibacillus contaminans]KOS68940.1 hypothetical protein AEA09_10540 [Lysinibacillus contaminans]
MSKAVLDKAKKIVEGIDFDIELAKDWSKDNYDNYYLYFSHPDPEIRKYSLLVFLVGLGNWQLGSAYIFRSIKELKKYEDFDEKKVYLFEDYVQSFLDNREDIKQEFPLLYNRLVWYLLRLDNQKRFEYIFRSVDKQLFIELRQVLIESGIDASILPSNLNNILREVGIIPYFLD